MLLWSPIIFFWLGYIWAGYTLTSLHPPNRFFDPSIARLENRFLGQPSLHWGRNRSRLLTEILHFGYFSYYFYTLSLGILFEVSNRFDLFQSMSFAVNFGYLVSYICFALIPVAGPRWYFLESGVLSPEELRQPGFLFTGLTHKLLYGGPAHKGGAMPSSHSSTALVFFLFVLYSWGWVYGFPALLLVIGMWIGAIYGRYHYLTDVVAGILLGILGVVLSFIVI
jgi:membrane-associated phospholipid phosphatase